MHAFRDYFWEVYGSDGVNIEKEKARKLGLSESDGGIRNDADAKTRDPPTWPNLNDVYKHGKHGKYHVNLHVFEALMPSC